MIACDLPFAIQVSGASAGRSRKTYFEMIKSALGADNVSASSSLRHGTNKLSQLSP